MKSPALRQALTDCRNTIKDCVEWTGWKNSAGYGYVRFEGRDQPAHRVVYRLLAGDIPDGLHLDHLCRNRACVNPQHLEPVTPRENTQRAHPQRAECSNGHEFTPENTYVRPDTGTRQCLACKEEAKRRFDQRRREHRWRAHLTPDGRCPWKRDHSVGHVSGSCPTCEALRRAS